ncbi:hypothetical protein [Carboxylicivirga caseinilyticus]|uniref:hypothetical protein n=1 Tax=Carboxylicivirga caseinilyticus TaxID=3417572 RepID=UPI003D3261A2|nr:hypothetical protein [Marinilabiliaceae bacterium A049]
MKSIFPVVSLIIATVIFASCNMGSKSSTTSSAPEIKKENVEKEVREFVYPLPTSFEVTEMLNRIEAAYILSLSNPVSNVEKYLTEKSQALNLGIYSADLSYASTYNQKQETVDFMSASKSLIEELDIAAALDNDLLQKIESNLDNKEALVDLITDSFYDTYEYLNKSERESVSLLVVSGSWVEALYISTHISEDTFNNKEMVSIIMNQKEPLNKLMTLLNQKEDNTDIMETIEDLKILHEIYNSIDAGSITEDQLTAIVENVAVVREKFVS